ncbi:MAG: DUF2752 domain-containing protein [Clostridia bacterium]|nr:DUF2752 domain-containing protein [Clostridia bacterium]
MEPKKSRRQEWLHLLLLHVMILAAALLYMAVMVKLEIFCPIRHFTGIPCPGCGMSRALGCLLRLDVEGSLRSNPALLPCMCAMFVLINRETILLEKVSLRVKDMIIGLGFGFTIVVYIVRMAFFRIP